MPITPPAGSKLHAETHYGASFHSRERITPSNRGIIHLGSVEPLNGSFLVVPPHDLACRANMTLHDRARPVRIAGVESVYQLAVVVVAALQFGCAIPAKGTLDDWNFDRVLKHLDKTRSTTCLRYQSVELAIEKAGL